MCGRGCQRQEKSRGRQVRRLFSSCDWLASQPPPSSVTVDSQRVQIHHSPNRLGARSNCLAEAAIWPSHCTSRLVASGTGVLLTMACLATYLNLLRTPKHTADAGRHHYSIASLIQICADLNSLSIKRRTLTISNSQGHFFIVGACCFAL